MRITYDAGADAVYFYLAQKTEAPRTRRVDGDIYVDYNSQNQLVGIEVLDASNRLVLSEIMPLIERIDTDWVRLTEELQKRKAHNKPVKVSKQRAKAWVEEIGPNYVTFRDEVGQLRRVKASQLLSSQSEDPLIETLRAIGDYSDYSIEVSQE